MSWEQLQNIIDEARQDAAEAQDAPPVACPIDGELLLPMPRGLGWYCPVGNYRYP